MSMFEGTGAQRPLGCHVLHQDQSDKGRLYCGERDLRDCELFEPAGGGARTGGGAGGPAALAELGWATSLAATSGVPRLFLFIALLSLPFTRCLSDTS